MSESVQYISHQQLSVKAKALADLLTGRGLEASVTEDAGTVPKVFVLNMKNGNNADAYLDEDGGFGWEVYGASPEDEPRSCREIADLLTRFLD